MAYVAMTRGRHNNEAFLYRTFGREADEHEAEVHTEPLAAPAIHRGTRYTAEHFFHQILGKNGRPSTVHAEAERTERTSLPDVVGQAIQRNAERRRVRMAWWRDHVSSA